MPAKGGETRGAAGVGLVERSVDEGGMAGDHSVIPWMSPSTVLRSLGSSCRRVWILSTAWRTVVWSLPPKARPTSASEAWVSWRARYRSEEHTSELQSHSDLVCRLLLEKKK